MHIEGHRPVTAGVEPLNRTPLGKIQRRNEASHGKSRCRGNRCRFGGPGSRRDIHQSRQRTECGHIRHESQTPKPKDFPSRPITVLPDHQKRCFRIGGFPPGQGQIDRHTLEIRANTHRNVLCDVHADGSRCSPLYRHRRGEVSPCQQIGDGHLSVNFSRQNSVGGRRELRPHRHGNRSSKHHSVKVITVEPGPGAVAQHAADLSSSQVQQFRFKLRARKLNINGNIERVSDVTQIKPQCHPRCYGEITPYSEITHDSVGNS